MAWRFAFNKNVITYNINLLLEKFCWLGNCVNKFWKSILMMSESGEKRFCLTYVVMKIQGNHYSFTSYVFMMMKKSIRVESFKFQSNTYWTRFRLCCHIWYLPLVNSFLHIIPIWVANFRFSVHTQHYWNDIFSYVWTKMQHPETFHYNLHWMRDEMRASMLH